MKIMLVVGAIVLLSACAAEPGSEQWCTQKKEQSKSEWTASDAATYARNCLIEGTAVGSKHWCESQSEKPRGEWTANETASYTKHCIM